MRKTLSTMAADCVLRDPESERSEEEKEEKRKEKRKEEEDAEIDLSGGCAIRRRDKKRSKDGR